MPLQLNLNFLPTTPGSMMNVRSPANSESSRKRRRFNDHQESPSRRPSEPAASPGELGSMRRGHTKDSSSFVGSGSGVFFVHTVQAAFARNRGRQESETAEDDLVPGEDDRLQSRPLHGSLWMPGEVEVESPAGQLIPFEEMVRWSQPYFDNWHPPFPFLLGSHVLGLFEEVSTGGMGSLTATEAVIVRSVMSTSLADRRQLLRTEGIIIPSCLIFSSVDEAISCLTPLFVQPSTVHGLQAMVAVQLFLISMLFLNAASRVGGLIVRVAFHLGLHRCPTKYEQFSPTDVDLRKRLFWTIYVFERYLAQSLGLPVDMKDDDIDVCYHDQELHRRNVGGGASKIEDLPDPRLLLLPALLARHGRIRGLSLELRHITAKNRVAGPDEVATIEAEISKWWNEAQDLLEPNYTVDSQGDAKDVCGLAPTHKLLLNVQHHESIILLNRPVLSSGHNKLQVSAAMQKCIGASKQIVSRVYQHLHSSRSKDEAQKGRTQNPLFWPGFTWCVWMSGLILVYAASEGHYSLSAADKEAERCVWILEVLSLRGSFWPGSCATALRDLQKALRRKLANRVSGEAISNSEADKGDGTLPDTSLNIRHPTTVDAIDNNGNPEHSSPSPSIAPQATTATFSRELDQNTYPQSSFHPTSNNVYASTVESFPSDNSVEWPNAGFAQAQPSFGSTDSQGFIDIFQLMDASYQMSEQMFDFGMNGFNQF